MRVDLFNELSGCYFSTVYHILKEAANLELTDAEYRKLVEKASRDYGFAETTSFIVKNAIDLGKNEEIDDNKDAWPFFDRKLREGRSGVSTKADKTCYVNKSRLNNISSVPLSIIEKRWLKSIYSDPRIQLFLGEGREFPELENVEPLFDWKDFVLFDQYADGDPFQDDHYIEMFRKVLKAVHNKSRLEIRFRKSNNNILFKQDGSLEPMPEQRVGTLYIDPDYLEYSERDDKFRLIGNNPRFGRNMVNISSIVSCEEVEKIAAPDGHASEPYSRDAFKKQAIFELVDDNNSLERFLFNFSHYEKEAEYLENEKRYRITITYDETDEMDLVIRTLSFGPHVRCIEPEELVGIVRDRIREQVRLMR